MGAQNDKVKELLASRLDQGLTMGETKYKDIITSSSIAYEKARHTKMPEMRKAILAQTLDQFTMRLKQSGIPQGFIKEAVENVGDVDNPISLMYAMISLLVPSFAYMDVAGVQPMPTEESPIFFQQLTANTTRNGVSQGTPLLGGTNWENNNLYTSNRHKQVLVGSGTPWTLTAAHLPLLPGKIKVSNADKSIVLRDNGQGGFTVVKGTVTLGAATVNYTSGAISIATSVGSLTGCMVDYRYDLNAHDPVQVLYEWATKPMKSYPRRARSIYALDNYYAAKQVLKGFDIDGAMNSSIAGYINKEISCGIFDNMMDEANNIVNWNKTLPTGVSWALHRLSILETLVTASNTLRKSIARSGGDTLVLGSNWMNVIETLGDDLWKPNKYGREPIGPYTAGVLADKFTVVKNQQFGDNAGFMSYKADDTDASYMVGVFIGLYNTDPIALDDLKVRRGIGTHLGESLLFDNSIIELGITAT
jgi:hypothetical protein